MFGEIKEPYRTYLSKGIWDEYLNSLASDGITWWFNMDTPSIAMHIAPLVAIKKKEDIKIPDRVLFLSEASRQFIPYERMDYFYTLFMNRGDIEAAAAAAGAGVASIWDSGRDFNRYRIWIKRINDLLKREDDLTPLAISSLLGFKGLSELTYSSDIEQAYHTYMTQRLWAEKARSHSLMIYFAAACSYCLIWMGRLSEAEVFIKDANIFCDMPDTNIVVKIYFKTTQGLFYYVKGEHQKAEKILRGIIELPYFETLPPPAYFLAYGHLLLTVASRGDQNKVEDIANKLRLRAIPEQNYFHYSYMQYNLGTAYLMLKQPHMALIYSNESIKRAKLSGSEIMEQISALLLGQVLSDMNKYHEALKHFTRWIEIWKKSGFLILASSGAFEIANIYLRMGKVKEARDCFKMAVQIAPEGEGVAHLNRSEEFFKKIKYALLPSTKSEFLEIVQNPEDMPVCIRAFGDLQIKFGDKIIYDRTWKGGRTKALLKALIVYGGRKVSYDLLIDTLWPETDGDTAESNLKVALSRLRRIGESESTPSVQWILVKQKKVSFARPICAVDSIIFKEAIDRIFNGEKNPSLLKNTLDLYRDDFLVRDQSELWIIKHREILKENFINGTILFAEMCKENGNLNDAVPYLYRALERDSLNEEIYACLMDAYLTLGYPSKAIQIYKRAKETLKRELNILPGNTLQKLAQQAGLKI